MITPCHAHAAPGAPEATASAGAQLFERNCAGCHGLEGTGGRGPSLRRPVLTHASGAAEIGAVVNTGIEPDMPASPFLSDDEIAEVAAYVYDLGQIPQPVLPGNPVKGRVVFERSGCLGCHILRGEGNAYGPELTQIGVTRGAEQLRKTVLDPRSTLPKDFQFVEAVTAGGQTIRGVRRNEDTLTLQLQDASGTFHSLSKADPRAFRRLAGETPMPSFAKTLSPGQLDDLVAYLAQQGRNR